MDSNHFLTSKMLRLLPVLTLAGVVLSHTAFAKAATKTYPEEGKVTGTGVNQVTRTRIYKVATDTRAYELDCGKRPFLFSSTPGECGGEKKIQIGDVIHFRIQKDRAYIQVPIAVESSGEQKLRIQREEAKPNAPAKKPDAN